MNNNTLAIVIGVIVLILIAFWVMAGTGNRAPESTTNVQVTSQATSTESAATSTSSGGTGTTVSGSVNVGTGQVKTFAVSGSNFAFSPTTLTVNEGDRVRITFKNVEGTHDLRLDEFAVNTGIIQGPAERTVEFVANKKGSFEYYCSIGQHRQMGMKGTLTVQ